MPITETVLLTAGFVTWALAFVIWLGHCLDRADDARAGLCVPRAWERFAYAPRLALVAGLPVLLGLGAMVARTLLLQAGG